MGLSSLPLLLQFHSSPKTTNLQFSLLTLLILQSPSPRTQGIVIQTTQSDHPLHYSPDCDKIRFSTEQFITCLCLEGEGVWAIYISNVGQIRRNPNEKKQWKIISSYNNHSYIPNNKNRLRMPTKIIGNFLDSMPPSKIQTPAEAQTGTGTGTGRKCLQLGEWVSRLKKISNSPKKSTIRKLGGNGNSNEFIVLNNQSWEFQIVDQQKYQKRKRILCLPGSSSSIGKAYCRYRISQSIAQIPLKEENFKNVDYCSVLSIVVKAEECQEFLPNESSDVENVCGFNQNQHQQNVNVKHKKFQTDSAMSLNFLNSTNYFNSNLNSKQIIQIEKRTKEAAISHRSKRDNSPGLAAASTGAGTGIDANELDEDHLGDAMTSQFTGDPQILDSITDYIKTAISNMLDLQHRTGRPKANVFNPAFKDTKPPTPIQKLLTLVMDIAKVTCDAINDDTFSIAMNSFITQQRDRNHLKEAYISYGPYERIYNALEKCKSEATPFPFVDQDTTRCTMTSKKGNKNAQKTASNSDQNFLADTSFTSNIIRKNGQNVTLPDLPRYAAANVHKFEPMVEVVWKTFLSAHSYCYPYFSDFFNDHHTFTVGVMPYFSNKIQDMWFLDANPLAGVGNSKLGSSSDSIVGGTDSGNSLISPLDTAKVDDTAYKSDRMWYGYLLGDVGKMLQDMDRCYQASRVTGDDHPSYHYPWYMNRPPRDDTNQWRRKKRAASQL